MKDKFGREINYMRISITDRCNLRCKYCMPEGIEWLPMSDILTYEEILDVCREAASLGIVKFKVTGGEPLVRKGCVELIREMKRIPGVEQVTMTSNGVFVADYLPQLLEAGLDAVNISLDTLDAAKYRDITGFDKMNEVLTSIDAAVGKLPVKVNCVLERGLNHEEWPGLVELARDRKLDVRFIELMPIGSGKNGDMVSNTELRELIRERYGEIVDDESIHGNGPATYIKIPGFQGSIGFISALHGKFCGACNRIRMTATGDIKPCLCFGDSISVREAVRAKDREQMRKILTEAIERKPQMHRFEETDMITEAKKMAQIGG